MNPLLLILLLPILEIVGFIQVGDWIGAGPTIGLLLLSAVVGVFLVRHRGLAALTRAQTATAGGQAPIGAVLDGFCEVIAGILLIVPGFLSDLVAIALLIRPLRRGLGRWLLARMVGKGAFPMFGGPGFGHPAAGSGPGFGGGPRPGQPFPPPPGVIDGDYRDVSEDPAADPADTRRLEDSQWGNRRPGGPERG
ncbi:FxsA family protein [Azospirillum doebereinerae]|uniref:FxsA family protein n=1 Tax=Azospirillum doebereinerae TaxID=92933 RepID=UPI001EE5A622|nr:FxsA family protein [Azospirillum doebereinerae]MCG5241916.1 FxsA family protein [Azospirillum doebereinerae]